MIEQMSDSYKREVEEFKKWPDNGSARINDSKSGFSPRPTHERPYEPDVSPALKSILDGTFNYASNRKSYSVRKFTHQPGLTDKKHKKVTSDPNN